MDIPGDVFEAALTAAGEGDPPAPADAPDPAPEPGEVETPAEEPEAPPAEGEGEGGEGGDPEPEAAPAEPSAATHAPVPQTFTAEQVQSMLDAALAKAGVRPAPAAAEPEPAAEVIPPHIAAMLRSEDAATKQWGEFALADHREKEARIAALEGAIQEGVIVPRIVAQKQAEIDGVKGEFVMLAEVDQPGADGKPTKVVVEQPVTDAHMDEVADYYDAHPETVGVLSIEEVTRRLHPNMVKRSAKSTPASTPKAPSQDATAGRRVVKVGAPTGSPGPVANGAASGRVPRPAPAPPENETLEQAIVRGMNTLGVQ